MFKLYHSDCLNLDLKDIRLIYLDPPYSSRKDKDGKGDEYYGVGESFEEYLSYMEARLQKLASFMDPKGSNILLHVDQKAVHYLKVIMDKIWGRNKFRNHIVWCYTGPSVVKSYLPRKHDDLLWYGIGEHPFNAPTIPYKSNLKVGGSTAWNPDKKGSEQEYLDRGKKLEDFWTDIPALVRNEGEKLGYLTQKPLKLMNRIVETFSNPGDLVYDPFMGSGSFLEAAVGLKRQALGSDISDKAISLTNERLSKLNKENNVITSSNR